MGDPLTFYELLSVARKFRAGGAGPKFTLQVLVEHMGLNDGEWSCWPSVELLAHETEQGTRTVIRHLTTFETEGLIEKRKTANGVRGRNVNTYVLNLGQLTCQIGTLVPTNVPTAADQCANSDTTNVPTATSAPYIEQPKEVPKEDPTPKAARGKRLPDRFTVSDEMRTWVDDEFPDLDWRSATKEFCDYWRAEPGAHGVKLDWVATWRNSMRRAEKDRVRSERWRAPRATKDERITEVQQDLWRKYKADEEAAP